MDWRTRILEDTSVGRELRYLFTDSWQRRLRGRIWELCGTDPGNIDVRTDFVSLLCRLLPQDVPDVFLSNAIIWLRKRLICSFSWVGKIVYSGMQDAPRLLELYSRLHRWLDNSDKNIHDLDYIQLRAAVSRGWRRAGNAEAKARSRGRWRALREAARRETEYIKGGPVEPPAWKGGEDRLGDWIDEAEWDIVVPRSGEAARYWGNGTFWCTSINGTETNYFKKYHNPEAGFVLFIFMNKRTGGMYQFEYGSRQFKDYSNNTCEDPVLVQGLHDMLCKYLRHSRYVAKRVHSIGEWIWNGASSIVLDEKGLLHSEVNGSIVPAVVTPRGSRCWYKRGSLHSWLDQPSYIQEDGARFWHKEGVLHRDAGPAIIWPDGGQEWWKNGERVR